jgi:hypothetical protein
MIFKFTNHGMAGLRAAMNDANEIYKMETISTALALCTSDVISGDLRMWRTHLRGTRDLLFAGIDHAKQLTILDPTRLFLMKWFAALDVFAGVSGLHKGNIPDGCYWSIETTPDASQGRVDEFMGYSLELMPILARIGRMARLQQKRGKIMSASIDSEDEEVRQELNTKTQYEVWEMEDQLQALFERSAPILESSPYPPEVAEEMRHTHRLFVFTALLHLYRRVQELPRNHPKPAYAVYMILETLQKLRPRSPATILLLWPVFSAGCETEDPVQRQAIQDRMEEMWTFGMGNVDRARKAMVAYWDSGAQGRWDVFMDEQGWDFVLF